MKSVVIHAAKDLRVEDSTLEVQGPKDVTVAIRNGGICGSDLHYYQHGGFGVIRVREPMVLGHEVAGEVVSVGKNVTNLAPGDKVAVSPSRPCQKCVYCLDGKQQHCMNMRFYGSAMPMPHIQGAFREQLVAHDWQCHKVKPEIDLSQAAFAEPFAVALHAVERAGGLFGTTVLVTGCGPIGALTLVAAKLAGAGRLIATDISDTALARVRELIDCETINVAKNPEALDVYKSDKGRISVMFEASGNQQAVRSGLEVLRPQGRLVQLGLGGDVSIPQNTIVAKEIEMRGSFRFHSEFGMAVDLINRRKVDFSPLLTHTFEVDDAVKAFEMAGDREQAMKVQLAF